MYASATPINVSGASIKKYGVEAFCKSPGCFPNQMKKKHSPASMQKLVIHINLISDQPWTDLIP